MPEQNPETAHDRKTEPEAAATFARRIAELVILLENRVEFGVRNTDAGIPDLDAQRPAMAPAAGL